MMYYRLLDDINYPNRWYLGDLSTEDNWVFTYGRSVRCKDNLVLDIYQDGEAMDYTTTEGYGVPIVTESLKTILMKYKGVDFIPVLINSDKVPGRYFVMVVTNLLEAVDTTKSEFEVFDVNDSIRPDKAGEYRSFFKLFIDRTKASGFRIFRLKNFDTAVIVNEEVKNELKAANLKGIVLQKV